MKQKEFITHTAHLKRGDLIDISFIRLDKKPARYSNVTFEEVTIDRIIVYTEIGRLSIGFDSLQSIRKQKPPTFTAQDMIDFAKFSINCLTINDINLKALDDWNKSIIDKAGSYGE